jgi:hypothetical protein
MELVKRWRTIWIYRTFAQGLEWDETIILHFKPSSVKIINIIIEDIVAPAIIGGVLIKSDLSDAPGQQFYIASQLTTATNDNSGLISYNVNGFSGIAHFKATTTTGAALPGTCNIVMCLRFKE